MSIYLTSISALSLLATSRAFAIDDAGVARNANCRLAFEDRNAVSTAQHLRDKISANFGVPFEVRNFGDSSTYAQAASLSPYTISISKWAANDESEPNLIAHEVVHVTTSRRNTVRPGAIKMTQSSGMNAVLREARFSSMNGEALLEAYSSYRGDEFEAYYKQSIYRLNIEDRGKYTGGWPNQIESTKAFGYSQMDIISAFLKNAEHLEIKVASDPQYPENVSSVEVTCPQGGAYKLVLSIPPKLIADQKIDDVVTQLLKFRIAYIKQRLADLDRRVKRIQKSAFD